MATSRLLMRSPSSSHDDAGGEREADQAPQRREADQAGAGRAGKADMRQRVAGEGLPAHHQEIADNARHHRDDAGGGEGVVHEFVVKHVSDDGVTVLMIVAMVVHVIGALDVAAARHHEDMAVGAHHLDFGAVQPRQHRRGHDFVDGAEHGLAVAEIEHAVDGAEQLVEFVRAEQHGDLALAADLAARHR